MRGFFFYLILVLQAKLVILDISYHYSGEYDLDRIRAHEAVERIKCDSIPHRTIFTVTPGFKSFKFTCLVRKENGCSRDEVYKYRMVECRPMDGLETVAALRKSILKQGEYPDNNPPVCIFEYSVKVNISKEETHHHCPDAWYYTENAEKIKLWTYAGDQHSVGRRVPMCYRTFKHVLTMSEARTVCGEWNATIAPMRNSIEEMAYMNSFRETYPGGLKDGYGWVGAENKCKERNASQACFVWDYDNTQMGFFNVWKDQPNALTRPGFDHERCLMWFYGEYPNYGYSDWHCECKGDLCNHFPIKAVTCAKDATKPYEIGYLPIAKKVAYYCDDETWIASRRSEFNGIPVCFKGAKVEKNVSYDESKERCAQWGAVIAPVENQDDMETFWKAMDRVFPDGNVAENYVYIAWRNIKRAANYDNWFVSDWDGENMLGWMGPLNWFNESTPACPGNYDPNALVRPGIPGWEDCVIADLATKKWRDWYCRCTPGHNCILNYFPAKAIACAKPANQFIY